MSPSSNGHTPAPLAAAISDDACRAVLERCCFGHLSFAREAHVDVVPIRFAFLEGSLYFRADSAMRANIDHNRWAVISVVDMMDSTHFASVVAHGACYATEETGSPRGDAAALRGILRLRDRVPRTITRPRRDSRTSIVFRLHVDTLRGSTTVVPCPAGGEDVSAALHSHASGSAESSGDGARADDDGMREPRDDRPSSGDVLTETP
jgi:nitroimidazol reductase NimA-like FMN-containing flavoprotein (pyridoxamine 5'-phosphate oxidase superfamily)